MLASDLDLRELLQFEPGGGPMQFAGQRALILDTVALGLLRRELIQVVGETGARGILTRFGYAHGWRAAMSIRDLLPAGDQLEWQRVGGRLHMLQGMVRVEPSAADTADPTAMVDHYWHDSYEAEQHLLQLGQAEQCVCWTLTGFASGYMSCCLGREILFLEDRCRGKGDAVCHVIGRPREDWGEACASQLGYFQSPCLNTALAEVAAEIKRLEQELHARRRDLGAGGTAAAVLGTQSPAMSRILDLAHRVAQVDSTILVTGESGAGKERIARLIHAESPRAGGPFLAINCGAVPETLLESELFGHARGAFTGAAQDRAGLFEAAQGGTLFLDEIGEVPPAMQVKLLRALQEREVRRVGENRNRSINVRVLAATNRDLLAEVHAARFRQDLYYRLRVIELRVPALRERREDILPLARHFLAEAARRTGREVAGFTPAAANQLIHYPWPGNVRELENAVEHAVVLAPADRIDRDDLPEEVGRPRPGIPDDGDPRTLDQVERDYILAVLESKQGNKVQTAAQLGIGAATLYRKLKEYGAGGS
jgi:DNA-binding NtrC family response regulator